MLDIALDDKDLFAPFLHVYDSYEARPGSEWTYAGWNVHEFRVSYPRAFTKVSDCDSSPTCNDFVVVLKCAFSALDALFKGNY